MPIDVNRARGLLWGQAVGDALGTTQEFTRPRHAPPFPALMAGPQVDLVGKGPFGLEPGQVTDDTQMAVALATSLAERGRYDPEDVARRYVAWQKVAFDVGTQTRAALTEVERGTPPLLAGSKVWERAQRMPAGNGSLMRASPLAVFFAGDPGALRDAALADSAITHADPRCRLATAAYVAALRSAIALPGPTAESMRRAAQAEIPVAAEALAASLPGDEVARAARALSDDLDLATRADPELYSDEAHYYRHAGFVRVTFRIAFWELLHAPSFEAACLDGTNRGGDSDTNAAVAGALHGALAGEAGIRADWRERVAGACRKKGGVWWETYHPRLLFRVLPPA